MRSVSEREHTSTEGDPEFERLAVSTSVGMERIRNEGKGSTAAFFGKPAKGSTGAEQSGGLRIVAGLNIRQPRLS